MKTDLDALSRVEARLKAIFRDDPTLEPFLSDEYFWGGGQMRSKVCVNLGRLFGLKYETIIDIAVFTELLHNASLIHDDIIDEDGQRRGVPAIWKEVGIPRAILIGDLLIAKSFKIASEANEKKGVRLSWVQNISLATNAAVNGAMRELNYDTSDSNFYRYLKMAELKTGSLFSLPVNCICDAAQINPLKKEQISGAFSKFAIAYQIKDDEADFLGYKKGRIKSSDLLNGRPNIFYLTQYSISETSNNHSEIYDVHAGLVFKARSELLKVNPKISSFLDKIILPFVAMSKPPKTNLKSSYPYKITTTHSINEPEYKFAKP